MALAYRALGVKKLWIKQITDSSSVIGIGKANEGERKNARKFERWELITLFLRLFRTPPYLALHDSRPAFFSNLQTPSPRCA